MTIDSTGFRGISATSRWITWVEERPSGPERFARPKRANVQYTPDEMILGELEFRSEYSEIPDMT
jgi:hypothetical protein